MKAYKGPEQWASLPAIPHTMHGFEQRSHSKTLYYILVLIIWLKIVVHSCFLYHLFAVHPP